MNGQINGKDVVFAEHATILEVARMNGHFIPTLCELNDLNHTPGTCRMCLVETIVPGKTEPQLLTSCDPDPDNRGSFTSASADGTAAG